MKVVWFDDDMDDADVEAEYEGHLAEQMELHNDQLDAEERERSERQGDLIAMFRAEH